MTDTSEPWREQGENMGLNEETARVELYCNYRDKETWQQEAEAENYSSLSKYLREMIGLGRAYRKEGPQGREDADDRVQELEAQNSGEVRRKTSKPIGPGFQLMVEVECAVEGCSHTFTSAQGLKSHFAFTHSLPSYQSEYEETKERIEAANEDTSDDRYPENWDEIRERVFARDDYQCQRCGTKQRESELHAHHQTPISKGGSHELSNLITLCQDCHSKEHGRPIGSNASTQKNQFQKGGDDILVECGICGNPAILQRNQGPNYVICENCGEYKVPDSG